MECRWQKEIVGPLRIDPGTFSPEGTLEKLKLKSGLITPTCFPNLPPHRMLITGLGTLKRMRFYSSKSLSQTWTSSCTGGDNIYSHIGKGAYPKKIKSFIWELSHSCIITQDCLQRRLPWLYLSHNYVLFVTGMLKRRYTWSTIAPWLATIGACWLHPSVGLLPSPTKITLSFPTFSQDIQ